MAFWRGKAARKQFFAEIRWQETLWARRRAREPRTLAVFRRLPPPGRAFPRRKGWSGRARLRTRAGYRKGRGAWRHDED